MVVADGKQIAESNMSVVRSLNVKEEPIFLAPLHSQPRKEIERKRSGRKSAK